MICLSTTHSTLDSAVDALRRNEKWVDAVELRADFLDDSEKGRVAGFPSLVEEALGRRVPAILTLRRGRDGGRYDGSDAERLSLLRGWLSPGGVGRGAEAGFDFVDLEEDLLENAEAQRLVSGFSGRVIRSFHDTRGTPGDLEALFERLSTNRDEIPKLAVRVAGSQDVYRVIELMVRTVGLPRIVLGMGAFGFPTRILGKRFGCMLSYTSDLEAPGTVEAAPGHLSPRALAEEFSYRDVDEDTALFAIIGNPVLHSRSPAYHTAAFREAGLNGLYLPFPVDDLDAFFETAALLKVRGLSVTIPHKEPVRRFLAAEEPAVSGAGACNTVLRGPDGWRGTNTDVPGFVEPLLEALRHARRSTALAGLRATVIGAGGAARGAVYALVGGGAEVLVLNRTLAKAQAIARDLGDSVSVAGMDAAGISLSKDYRDIVVQTTSVGMTPKVDEDPLPSFRFLGSEIVYDLVYTPAETRFLTRAREAGCSILSGMAMFRRQAELQQELFRSRF
jgi:3-dehydroquinate dehydratase / shikimate dehydrogenase